MAKSGRMGKSLVLRVPVTMMNNFQMISYLTGRSECYNRFGGVVAGCLAWLETGVAREAGALGLGFWEA